MKRDKNRKSDLKILRYIYKKKKINRAIKVEKIYHNIDGGNIYNKKPE
jgi:hypothetical protein